VARIITKELALRIVKKLEATPLKSSSKAHDEYLVQEDGIQIAILSVRRSSNKEIGHDYFKNDLHISPHQAKELGQCPWKRPQFIAFMRETGHLPALPDDETEADEQTTE